MNIYITGIDGAGKTTIIERIIPELFPNEKVEVIWARYEPKLIRYLVAPLKKSQTNGSTNFNDMNEQQYNKWSSFKKKITKSKVLSCVIFTIQYIEYSITIKKVFSKLRKSPNNTIVDRFILDFLVDQSVNHGLNLNNWIVKRLLFKLNAFSYVIFIDVEEHIALVRKNDIPSKEYLSVRRKFYKEYIELLGNAVIVCNNNSLEDTIANISKKIKKNESVYTRN
ncbi:nucleoside/nucleotide kinase family protein [Acetobacteroides hydrogenigenes]|uniref:Thymidylate kinase n=1 Tax=Acetobacteroides hydrogenigenes TaxID=979970 RepID=A0A4R2EU89_9BACT|nr:hypothetical protein [Acetobacteroides hydrogenigenes]TCN72137.1 thymidylate kinase [Acetobacteroides hydrogenigenes]